VAVPREHVAPPIQVVADDETALPLVIDVDGTLLRTDLLLEAVLHFVRGNPVRLVRLARWLRAGKTILKDELARAVPLAAADLPYNAAVLERIRAARAAGRPIYLASASPRERVTEIARHLGDVDGVFASDRTTNLKGERKARALVEAFGEGGFDYLGNGADDAPSWRRARRALAVRAGAGSVRRARPDGADVLVLADPPPPPRVYLEALRPRQWSKNLLLFLPLLAAHSFNMSALAAAGLGFVAFSLAASSAYVVNDLADLQEDRRHHGHKSHRPFAAAVIPLGHGLLLAPTLLVLAFGVGMLLPTAFVAVLAVYVATTLLYSFLLRHKPLIDVLTLALLYTLRAVAGAVAIATTVSPWLSAFCLALFLCLAIVKRLTELAKVAVVEPGERIRGYYREDGVILAAMAAASGFGAVLVLALYINSEQVRTLYTAPDLLWGVCVALLYWVSRILLLSHRGQISDDPIVWALRNRISLATIAGAFALVVTASYV